MPHETTEITERILAFRDGRIAREALLTYLTEDVRYAIPVPEEHPLGSAERYWAIESGTVYTPGSFDEVTLAVDTGLLPRDVYAEILEIFWERSTDDGGA